MTQEIKNNKEYWWKSQEENTNARFRYNTSRLKIENNGFCPVPITPGYKAPKLDGWQFMHNTEIRDMIHSDYGTSLNSFGVGLLLAQEGGGLIQNDFDVYDEDLLDKILEALTEDEEINNIYQNSLHVQGQPPKRSFICRFDGDWQKLQTEKETKTGKHAHDTEKSYEKFAKQGHEVEIRVDSGQQCVIMHIHPDEKKPYKIFGSFDPMTSHISDLPLMDYDAVRRVRRIALKVLADNGYYNIVHSPTGNKKALTYKGNITRSANLRTALDKLVVKHKGYQFMSYLTNKPDMSVDQFADMLYAIPSQVYADFDQWYNFTRAMHHAAMSFPRDAKILYEFWDTTSAHTPGYNSQVNRGHWDRLKGSTNPIRMGSIVKLAKKYGWNRYGQIIQDPAEIEKIKAKSNELQSFLTNRIHPNPNGVIGISNLTEEVNANHTTNYDTRSVSKALQMYCDMNAMEYEKADNPAVICGKRQTFFKGIEYLATPKQLIHETELEPNNEHGLSREQNDAMHMIVDYINDYRSGKARSKRFFLTTGSAGSGKTLMIAALEKYVKEGMTISYVTFQGKNAGNLRDRGIDAKTIHSAHLRHAGKDAEGNIIWVEKINSDFELADVIVIDEAYQVDDDLAKHIFGNQIPVLAFGDPNQMGPNSGADAFCEHTTPDFHLQKVHRQDVNNPVYKLAEMVKNKMAVPNNYEDGTTCVIDIFDLTYPQLMAIIEWSNQFLCGTNESKYFFNEKVRDHRKLGSYPEPGERIICLRNQKVHNRDVECIYNGDVFIIDEILEKRTANNRIKMRIHLETNPAIFAIVDVNGEYFGARHYRIEELKDGDDGGGYAFEYAYTMTVNKSQGAEFTNVAIFNEAQMFGKKQWNWLYTAITRAKRDVIILYEGDGRNQGQIDLPELVPAMRPEILSLEEVVEKQREWKDGKDISKALDTMPAVDKVVPVKEQVESTSSEPQIQLSKPPEASVLKWLKKRNQIDKRNKI